jgi:hypothetical protein
MNTQCCNKVIKSLEGVSCKNHRENYPTHMNYDSSKCQYAQGYCWQRKTREELRQAGEP